MSDRETGFYWLTSEKGRTVGLWEESFWEIISSEEIWTEAEIFHKYTIGSKVK